jgi:uncharacterized membrane protein
MSGNAANRQAPKSGVNTSLATRFHRLLLGVLVSITAVGFNRIPADFVFPAHWGAHGMPDWVWPRDMALVTGPAVAAVILAVFGSLHWVIRKTRIEMIRHNAEPAISAILLLFCAVQLGLVLTGIGSDIDLIRIVALLVAAAVLVLGLVISEAERHTYAGVRLPWQIESDKAWRLAHSVAGWLFVAGALALAALAWLQPDMGTLILAFPLVLTTPLIAAAILSALRP